MRVLAIDVGSSAVRAAIVKGVRLDGTLCSKPFPTRREGESVDVDANEIMRAVIGVVKGLGKRVKDVDVVAIGAMGPSWLAMDKSGKAISRVITHQDRRSLAEAHEIERAMGEQGHRALAGNRPVPGGISSTSYRWMQRHAPGVMKRARIVGHLNTFLVRWLTGEAVTDPSHAAFMGMTSIDAPRAWNDQLIAAVGARRALLPRIVDASEVAGKMIASTAGTLGMRAGVPVLPGIMDGSCAMLLAGAERGRLVNVIGSTDVLAMCVEKPMPHEDLLTRPLGVGDHWLSVGTIAAAGSAVDWMRKLLFPEMSDAKFYTWVRRLTRTDRRSDTRRDEIGVEIEPHFAGSRTQIEPMTGAIRGLTLGTDRELLLEGLLDALALASFERWRVMMKNSGIATSTRGGGDVHVTGGGAAMAGHYQRYWPGRWKRHVLPEATLRGLGRLAELARGVGSSWTSYDDRTKLAKCR